MRLPARLTPIALTLALATAACHDPTAAVQRQLPSNFTALSLGTGNSITDLGLLAGMTESNAYSVNNSGLIVGYSSNATGAAGAFSWTSAGGIQALAVPAGWTSSYAFGVNDSSKVAGVALNSGGTPRAVVWSGASMTDLGALVTGGASFGFGINVAGQVAGYATTATGGSHATLYTPGSGLRDLGTLPSGGESFAQAVNASGLVVGWAVNSSGKSQGFYWTAANGMIALPTLSGQRESAALGVNNAGDIVGFAVMASNGATVAVAWPDKGNGGVVQLTNLTTLPSVAFAINNNKTIVGYGTATDGKYRAILWNVLANNKSWGTAVDLKLAGTTVAGFGQAINDGLNGQPVLVAGLSSTAAGNHAYLWQ